MKSHLKKFLPPVFNNEDVGIRPIHGIDEADWVWHPDLGPRQQAFVRFEKTFTCDTEESLTCHLSADQFYEFRVDGRRISRGPERGELDHWSFSSYEIKLEPGEHTLQVLVYSLGDSAPLYQQTYRGAFIFKADGPWHEVLTTGQTEWKATELRGWAVEESTLNEYHVVGNAITLQADEWFNPGPPKMAETVRSSILPVETGGCEQGWRLYPAVLPDQMDVNRTTGKIRAVLLEPWQEAYLFEEKDCRAELLQPYAPICQGEPLRIPAGTSLSLLWDLEEYYCGYAHLETDLGADARIEFLWAESLFQEDKKTKGNRNEITGKLFCGFGDAFISDGKPRVFESHRWLSGRYILLNITTGEDDLVLKNVAVNETRYPLENTGSFNCATESFETLQTLCTRVMQMCSHDSFMDCPYYEQLMYVGDTRLEMLTTYTMTRDDTLVRRCIDLFDYSRRNFGFVAEHFPSRQKQCSVTFSMIHTWLVHDYLYYRGDTAWLKDRIYGVRSSLDLLRPYVDENNLLKPLPGWSFIDWVPEWNKGYPPDAREGTSGIINLTYYWSLKKAAELEDALGEDHLAMRYRQFAEKTGAAIIKKFWNEDRTLFADDLGHDHFSEHSQCLAILSGLVEGEKARTVFAHMLKADDLHRTTVYFRHYLFETMKLMDRGDLIIEGFGFWHDLVAQGFKTTVEMPEPSRSDCHAWGAHPMYHLHASLLGIRPASIGSKTVTIKPSPGKLPMIKAETPHPAGFICTDLSFAGTTCRGTLSLPANVTGEFIWDGNRVELKPGSNEIDL